MTIQNTMKLMPKAWVHPQVFQGVHRQLWSGSLFNPCVQCSTDPFDHA